MNVYYTTYEALKNYSNILVTTAGDYITKTHTSNMTFMS